VSEPRKHHYVPVFYQRNFANSEGLLWVYDRRLKTYKELNPRVICFEKDLYAVKPEHGVRDRRLESLVLSVVDGVAAAAIRELRVGRTPEFSTADAIAYFVGVQFNRLPSMAKLVSDMHRKGAEEVMRLLAVDVNRMKSAVEDYTSKTDESVDVTPESMVDAVKGGHIEVSVSEVPWLKGMFKHAESLSKLILKFVWQILVAPPESGFITCDSPVVVVPPAGVGAVGFAIPGTVTYFPLTRRLCLRLSHNGPFGYRHADRETVRIVNHNIAASSERFVMGAVKAQLEGIISRSRSTDQDAVPRFTLDTPQEDEDGSLQRITFNPRRYFYLKNGSGQPP
jgi:hypothetical protein